MSHFFEKIGTIFVIICGLAEKCERRAGPEGRIKYVPAKTAVTRKIQMSFRACLQAGEESVVVVIILVPMIFAGTLYRTLLHS
jgi:hypothetical protein